MERKMKIMLICAGGMSTGLLMKKLQDYAKEHGVDLVMEAHGVRAIDMYFDQFDIIMIGPQVRFKLNEIKQLTDQPIGVISSADFASMNCEAIFKMAEELYAQLDAAKG